MNGQIWTPGGSGSGQWVERILAELAADTRPAFCTARGSLTWAEWVADVTQITEDDNPGRALVGLVFRPHARSYAWLAALASLNSHVFLLDENLSQEATEDLARRHRITLVVDPCEDGSDLGRPGWPELGVDRTGRGEVTIFTSGSTGPPKPVHHDWETLTRPVRLAGSPGSQTWLLTYRPQLYAGLQVFLHCLLNRGTMIIPDPNMAVDDLVRLMSRHDVRYISATPSYWRRLITLGPAAELRALRLEQITLGGEASDQALLDSLKRLFPRTRVVHIYATSELGRCFSVKDGRAGFPASYLEGLSEEGVALKIEDDELHVRSANAMLSDPDLECSPRQESAWIATGDLIERIGDRCYFVGRRTELINVGGNKVHPLRVEQVVQGVSGVADVRVFGKTSSLVGQMVACEFAVAEGADRDAVKQEVLRECRERLAPHERPRFLEIVEKIQLSEAGKKVRKSG